MTFKKALIPIQMIPASPRKVEFRQGYVSGEYGFHRDGKEWKAIDLLSGCYICSMPSRKACVEWIEANQEKLSEKKKEADYHNKVLYFYNNLRELY